MLALAAVSAAMSARQQSQKNDAIEESYRQRQEQQETAGQVAAFERSRQARRERARIKVASGESGIAGNSVGLQIANSRFQEGFDNQTTRVNTGMAQDAARSSANAQMGDPIATGVQTGLSIGGKTLADKALGGSDA